MKAVLKFAVPGLPYFREDCVPWHYHRLGTYGIHDVHLGIDGMLYTLNDSNHVDQMISASDLPIAAIDELSRKLPEYFKASDESEELYVAIEKELAEIVKHPRPKALGNAYSKRVIVDVPMPHDKCSYHPNPDGTRTHFNYLRVWRLPYTHYSVDQNGRLVEFSKVHKVLAVVHLRSIMERSKLRDLHSALRKTRTSELRGVR